jgi:general secretion pathway protein B
MSFILDALKKSETERQRADSPALYEVKKAPPRQRVATWLIVLAGLLIINVAVLGVVLLRGGHSAPPATEANTAAPPPLAAATTVVMPAPAAASPTVVMPPPVADAPAPDFAGSAPTDAVTRQSDDDAPAVEPPPAAASSGQRGGLVRELGTGVGEIPSYDQLASVPGANLPELKLDLHAYAPNPADRFIFLNMVKLQEGQTSPQGVRVETITPDGAILSWQGSRFLLQRQ